MGVFQNSVSPLNSTIMFAVLVPALVILFVQDQNPQHSPLSPMEYLDLSNSGTRELLMAQGSIDCTSYKLAQSVSFSMEPPEPLQEMASLHGTFSKVLAEAGHAIGKSGDGVIWEWERA